MTKQPLRRMALSLLVVGVFIALVEYLTGWRRVLSAWSAVPAFHVVAALALITASHACRGARLQAYLLENTAATFSASLRVTLIHNLSNHVLPFRTGELAFPVLLNRSFGVPAPASFMTLLWFRALDIVFILAAGGVLLAASGIPRYRWFALLVLLLPLPFVAYAMRSRLETWLSRIHHERLRSTALGALAGLPTNTRRLWIDAAWTALTWATKLMGLGILVIAFTGVEAAFGGLAAMAGELMSVLPLHTPAGIGTYEAGVVGALHYGGVSVSAGVEAAVNVHLALLAVAFVYGGIALGAQASPKSRRTGAERAL